MSRKEKPLPEPPKRPLARKRFAEREEDAPLVADRMAAAMAEGRLEEFMKEAMPDSDYARSLAALMMGMTGMMPPGSFPLPPGKGPAERSENSEEVKSSQGSPSPVQPPEELMSAVHAGDLKGVMEILAREHNMRMPSPESEAAEEKRTDDAPGLSDIEKETLNELIRIASENNVGVDWMVLRALRLYIREYQKTGRL